LRTAPRALSTRAWRRTRLAKRVRPLRRLPALSWLPGQRPAQDAAWPAVGKRVMSQPSSATIVSAVRRATPGDGVEPRDRVGLGGGARRDVAIAGRDGVVEELDVAQGLGQQEAVMGRDAPGERLGARPSGTRWRETTGKGGSFGIPKVPTLLPSSPCWSSLARFDSPRRLRCGDQFEPPSVGSSSWSAGGPVSAW
jgi:hypothetical protein